MYAMEVPCFLRFCYDDGVVDFGSVFYSQLSTKKDPNKNGMLGMGNLVFVCRNGYHGSRSM